MSVRVKICGLTNEPDAWAAIEAGADALGFVFCESSSRCVPTRVAAEIIRALPPFVAKVGVFVDAPADTVRRAVEQCGLDTLQFHGSEPPEFCRQFGLKAVKAFRIRNEASLNSMPAYSSETWLLDSFVAGKPGGTGEQFNWLLACKAKKLGRPVILAGGLHPGNVAQAVREVRPYAVDVSSGVELAPGKKDHQKVKEFVQAAKAAGLASG